MPASALASAGLIDARIDVQLWSETWLRAVKPDIIVFQRQIEKEQIEAIKLARAVLPSAFLIYELDDAMDDVPASSFHSGFVPPGVTERIAEALSYCDAASTTTEPLAGWLRELGCKDVRVIGNLLPNDKVVGRQEPNKRHTKIRVGFAGGISHGGDLTLIEEAINEIGTAVDWVFMGCRPNTDVPIEFHGDVPVTAYQDALAKLDLDLVLAPLESNFFNDCKSNLRLIEAGACGAAVIAQASIGYLENAPPVSAFATTPESWTKAIKDFIALPMSKRRQAGAAMHAWVVKHYTYEGQMEARLRAWMPAGLPSHFRPASPGSIDAGKVTLACPGGAGSVQIPDTMPIAGVHQTIEDAAAQAMGTGTDLLWLRPGTTLTAKAWRRMCEEAIQPGVATVSVLGNDGCDAFPTSDRFTPVPGDLAAKIDNLVSDLWRLRIAELTAPCGAAILIRAPMLSLLGSPDEVGMDGNAEAALVEWGVRASVRTYKHIQVLDSFIGSLAPPRGLTESMATRMKLKGGLAALQAQKPSLTQDERQAVELGLVVQQWTGPRPGIVPFGSDYATWAGLHRERPLQMADNCKLAVFGGSLPLSEWLIFIDPTLSLKPGAASQLIQAAGKANFVYADHDVVTPEGLQPVFKPDFDYELALATDYLTPVMAVRTSALARAPRDRLELYNWVLQQAPDIAHCPVILGTVTPPYSEIEKATTERRARIVSAHVAQFGVGHAEPHPTVPGAVKVKRHTTGTPPKVSIIITTKGEGWVLQPCLLPLLHLTSYPNFEVIVVHNNHSNTYAEIGAAKDDPRVKVVYKSHAFNWSKLNNFGATYATGDYLLFLNDDTRLISPDWLTAMVATAQQPGVGVVGARLLFPQGTVQHAGVVAHNGMIGHTHITLPANSPGYMGLAMLTHEASAVTGACMLVSREIFDKVGRFREDLSHNYNDIAFCLEVRKLELRNVVECRAELSHIGGATRPGPTTEEGTKRLLAENAIMARDYMQPDPYWNPNFALTANGLGVQGLGYDTLAWPHETPSSYHRRTLVINDTTDMDSASAVLTRQGDIVFVADISGFTISMIAPALASGVWDIRQPDAFIQALETLKIERLVLRGLTGKASPAAGVEALRLLNRLGIPLEYSAQNGEVVCPRINFLQNGVDCGGGWKKGIEYCQTCVNMHGSPFGHVDVEAWRTAWADIINPVAEARDAAD